MSDLVTLSVYECSEFHSMGEFHENLTLQQAVDIYKSIPSDRMNGVKTIGFVINDDQLLANEYDLVVYRSCTDHVADHALIP